MVSRFALNPHEAPTASPSVRIKGAAPSGARKQAAPGSSDEQRRGGGGTRRGGAERAAPAHSPVAAVDGTGHPGVAGAWPAPDALQSRHEGLGRAESQSLTAGHDVPGELEPTHQEQAGRPARGLLRDQRMRERGRGPETERHRADARPPAPARRGRRSRGHVQLRRQRTPVSGERFPEGQESRPPSRCSERPLVGGLGGGLRARGLDPRVRCLGACFVGRGRVPKRQPSLTAEGTRTLASFYLNCQCFRKLFSGRAWFHCKPVGEARDCDGTRRPQGHMAGGVGFTRGGRRAGGWGFTRGGLTDSRAVAQMADQTRDTRSHTSQTRPPMLSV